jgi:signal peptidase I
VSNIFASSRFSLQVALGTIKSEFLKPKGHRIRSGAKILRFNGWGKAFGMFLLAICILGVGDRACAATTYYIASTGSDTNNGTSTSTPWLHAPGMPNCKSVCASTNPQPGDSIIFRGGDTWHFGNSSASPYAGGMWAWAWSGSSGNNIYIGVNKSWYSGSAWARPILTADNLTSTSAVSSCAYQVGNDNTMVSFNDRTYVTMDNFELTGLCENSSSGPYGSNTYISDYQYELYENIYAHGWTHTAFNCAGGGLCFAMQVFDGSSNDPGSTIQYTVIDGSDSDPAGSAAIFNTLYDVHDSVVRYTANILGASCHTFHDNLVEYSYEPGDNVAHGNVYECDSDSAHSSSPTTFYNNLIRHAGNVQAMGVGFWPAPAVGTTDYYFNNVIYDINAGSNYFNVGQNSNFGNQGTLAVFSNVFENPANGAIVDCGSTYAHPLLAANNQYITNAASQYSVSGGCSGATTSTELLMAHATATADGYTTSENFAYSPTSASSPTVGSGTNEQSYCGALSGDSSASAACNSDTTYACTYNSTNHTVSCPSRTVSSKPSTGAWNIGAYQYRITGPQPPTNVRGVAVAQ